MSHRRQTLKSLHSSGSNIALDALAAPPPYPLGSVSNMGDPASSTAMLTTGGVAYPGFEAVPRSIRKGLPMANTAASTESDDDEYPSNGTLGKKSRRRSRAASFTYLPFHRRKRSSSISTPWWRHPSSWRLGWGPSSRKHSATRSWVFWVITVSLFWAMWTWHKHYEIQLEYAVFSRQWVRREMDAIKPLRGCFDAHHISPHYNLTQHLAPRRQSLASGIALRRGLECYDFSATIQPIPGDEISPVLYHTYWRSDLLSFGERQTATLTAFLATQPLTHSKLILWTNGVDTLTSNEHVRPFLEKWGEYIEIRQVDMNTLTKGTELEGLLSGIDGGGLFDERAWVDGDAVRLLVLWHHGGIWMDMDQILTRDLHPLTESEFVTQWDCYDKPYFSLNGALMHFHRHSPYLCEAFHIMASSPLPRPNTFTWGSHLYSKLHRRLLAGHVKPFDVLPWCFADPRNCRSDIRFPDPFAADPARWAGRRWDGKGEVGRSGREMLEERVGSVWSVHLHNQWMKSFPRDGWVDRLLQGYKRQVERVEAFAKAVGRAEGERVLLRRDADEDVLAALKNEADISGEAMEERAL